MRKIDKTIVPRNPYTLAAKQKKRENISTPKKPSAKNQSKTYAKNLISKK